MGLFDPKPRPVPPGPPTCPGANGQLQAAQSLDHRKARRIDSGGILERKRGFRFYLWVAPLGGGLLPLGNVAGVAAQRQVRHPVRAAPTARPDVVEFKGGVGASAI